MVPSSLAALRRGGSFGLAQDRLRPPLHCRSTGVGYANARFTFSMASSISAVFL